MTDSLKLAGASIVGCGVAWSGCLRGLGSAGATAAFVLYFIWPVLSLAMVVLTMAFGIRELRQARRWGAFVAVALSFAVLAFSWTRFQGWE
jgi:hypothetical protein